MRGSYRLTGKLSRTTARASASEPISPTAIAYTSAIPLNTSLQASARIRYVDGTIVRWSPITRAKFKYNLSPLHVTEVMYNPAPPPAGNLALNVKRDGFPKATASFSDRYGGTPEKAIDGKIIFLATPLNRWTSYGSPEISQASSGGREVYRVRLGPYTTSDAAGIVADRLKRSGYGDARVVAD